MPSSNRPPRAPGAIIVLLLFAGVLIGALRGEPTLGALGGLLAGGLAALLMYLRDQKG